MDSKQKQPSFKKALLRSRQTIKDLTSRLNRKSEDVKSLQEEIEHLKNEISQLKEEIKILSGAPKWVKPNKDTSLNKKDKKKLGPKDGHKPNSRTIPKDIDQQVKIIPKVCPECSHELPYPHKWHRHIQVELPPPVKPITTEYIVGWCYCKHCKKEVSSKERLNYSAYGAQLHSQISYWKFGLGLTLNKIEKLLKDQYGLKISTGVISGMINRTANRFNGAYSDIKTSLIEQENLYADETGWRSRGNNYWLWSFSNDQVSYYVIDKSRGKKVIQDILGSSFGGVLSSDFYSAYNRIRSKKQKCWTHLLRELRELKEKYPKDGEIRYYKSRMKMYFKMGIKLKEAFQNGEDISGRYERLTRGAIAYARREYKHPELIRLSKRIFKYRSELFTFIKEKIEPTNNHAEREIRPAVLMRKISYGNRSDSGAQNQAILMSIIRSCQKKDIHFTNFAANHLASTTN